MEKGLDLSRYHHTLSDEFPNPLEISDWSGYQVDEAKVAFFKEQGYLPDIKILNDDQIALLKNELEDLMDEGHPGNHLFYEYHRNESSDTGQVLFHCLGHWRITPGFHDVLWHPRFLAIAWQLLDKRPVRFWHDQLFCKPARHGGVVAWHQDYSYWTRTKAMQHLTCWIGLDDSTVENGCIHYIPRSHKWGLLDKPELAGDMDGIMEYLTPEQKRNFNPKPIELKAGHATFHHPLMVHGSYANNSNHKRRALVINVFADGTISDTDEELLQGVPLIGKGSKIEGQFFPLLHNPD